MSKKTLMGINLATGLMTKAIISKRELEKEQVSTEALLAAFENVLHFDLRLFKVLQNEEWLWIVLQESVLHDQLLPFLEAFYPKMYDHFSRHDYNRPLRQLRETAPSDWLAIAQKEPYQSFQYDRDAGQDHVPIAKPDRPTAWIEIRYEGIILSSEGKIWMETYGQQFNFYKYCMVQAFLQHPIASALRVYLMT